MRLFITPKTVNNHLFNARKKLNIHKSVELFLLNAEKIDTLFDSVHLTRRWRDVLRLHMNGFTDIQIGKILGISYSAVRRHKERMLISNNCDSMRSLVALYQKNYAFYGDTNNAG